MAQRPLLPGGARRRAVRPRCRRHEERACGHGHCDRGIRARPSRSTAARSPSSSPATRKVRRSTARKRVVETAAGRGERIDWCLVGEPSSEAVIGDTIKVGRRGSLQRPADGARRAGARRLPAARREPGAHPGAGARRADAPRVGPGHRALPADQLPGLEPQRRHRRTERDPRRAQGAVQPALLAGPDPGRTQARPSRASSRTHGVRYTLEWYVSGEPFYTPPGAAVARRSAMPWQQVTRLAAEALDRRRHLGRALHRPAGGAGGGARRGERVDPQGERVRAARRHRCARTACTSTCCVRLLA